MKFAGRPLYFGLVEGFETSCAVVRPSEPGAPLGQSLISAPRSADIAVPAHRQEHQINVGIDRTRADSLVVQVEGEDI